MKKTLMMLLALTLVTATQAQTQSGFEIGVELTDYGYRERFEGEEVARDDGRFFGLSAGYTKKFDNRVFLRGRLNVDSGSADYESDGERLDDVDQGIGRLEFHAGRDFKLTDRTTISPFAGLGARVLIDESGGRETESGLLGYDRRVRYSYVPLGVAAGFSLPRNITLTVSSQYNWLESGEAESKFSDIDPELPDVTVDLNDGSGYELAAMLSIPIRSKRLSFGPFVRGWNIDQSESFIIEDPEGSGETIELFEPKNRTREAGVRLSFRF